MHAKLKEKADFKIANVFDGIEIVSASYNAQAFSRHVHEAYTIGVIEQGVQRFYRSGDVHIAETDSIILVNTDDVHTGESASPDGWKYQAMYPKPEHYHYFN